MSTDPVERKADGDADRSPETVARTPQNRDDGEEDPVEAQSATGAVLVNIGLPSRVTLARTSLGVLLFGGLLSVAVGATLWVSQYGFEATLAFSGVWAILVAYLLAQVYSYRGWI